MNGNGAMPDPSPQVLGALLRGEPLPEDDPGLQARQEAEEPSVDLDNAGRTDSEAPEADAEGAGATTERDGAGDAPPTPPEPAADAEGASDPDGEGEPEGYTVRDLADRLGEGTRAADVYRDLRVGLPDGRGEVSLDELKQGYLANAELEDQRSEFTLEREEYNATRETNRLQDLKDRAELTTILSVAANHVPPAVVAQAQQVHTETMAREGEALIRAKPEWRDPTARAAAAEDHLELLAKYGIGRADYQAVQDHRLLLVLDDHARLVRERDEALDALRKAREAAQERTPRTGQRRGGARAASSRLTREARRPGAGTDTQVSAVASVLRGGK